MRILMIGDIVGKPGRQIVVKSLAHLRQREGIDVVVANAENAAAGSGITKTIYRELIDAGVDCVTLGDHIYRRSEIIHVLQKEDNILKPANYPESSPGKGWTVINTPGGRKVAVISLLGRVFMKPVDCPWQAIDRILGELPTEIKVILVDFHAEATSDKQLMGRYLDGRVTAVLGTHTHVPTADECVFSGGTAFQCDLGMTGPYDSILGRKIERVLETTRTFCPTTFDVASGDVRLSGTVLEVDPSTGKATDIRRLVVRQDEVDEWLK